MSKLEESKWTLGTGHWRCGAEEHWPECRCSMQESQQLCRAMFWEGITAAQGKVEEDSVGPQKWVERKSCPEQTMPLSPQKNIPLVPERSESYLHIRTYNFRPQLPLWQTGYSSLGILRELVLGSLRIPKPANVQVYCTKWQWYSMHI